MLNSLLVRSNIPRSEKVDFGRVAEAMVFYQEVHLFLSGQGLEELVRNIGLGPLLQLITEGYLKLTITPDILATHSSRTGIRYNYDFVSVRLLSQDRRQRGYLEVLEDALERATGNRSKSRRAAKQLLNYVPLVDISEGAPHQSGIPEMARQDLDDPYYVRKSVEDVIERLAPDFRPASSWDFMVRRTENGFLIETDLDFEALNTSYHKVVSPEEGNLEPAHLIDWIQSARADMFLASKYSSELMTNDLLASIIARKCHNLVSAHSASTSDIQLFQNVYLDKARAISDAINNRERTVRDLMKLLDHGQKFRDWIAAQPDDSSLLKEYTRSVTAGTWAERLPGKATRFAFFTGAGLLADVLAPGSSILLGAADNFLLDKMIAGWKPSQFVNGPLRGFVNRTSS